MAFSLSSPNRPIRAGVILMGETEILDVGPIDILNGMSNRFVTELPIPDELKAKSYDIDFHWVTEGGKPAKLTAGMTVQATVSLRSPLEIQTVS
jgi:hypothetical protein